MFTQTLVQRKSRSLMISALAVFMLLLQGCSFVNELFIFNETGDTIVVRWRFGSKNSLLNSGKPRCYKATVSGDEVHIGSDTVKFYCRTEGDSVWYAEVPASAALTVGTGLNQDLTQSNIRNEFVSRLEVLDIVTPNDKSFSCQGTVCSPHFVAIGKSRAVHRFR